MYKYQVNYSKRFLDGLLKGMLYHDHLRFADWHSANQFKELCESGHVFEQCHGNGSYKTEDIILSALD